MTLDKAVFRNITTLVFLGLTWSLSFATATVNLEYAPAATSVFLRFLIASAFMALFFGKGAIETMRRVLRGEGRRPFFHSDRFLVLAAAIGAGMAFYLQVATRSTFGPPGSNVAFLLATTPVFVIALASLAGLDRVTWGKLAGSAAALLGTIAIVGNWERPSSFSPFTRFASAELTILLGVASLAVFAVAASKLAQRHAPTALATLTIWLSTLIMLATALVVDGPLVLAQLSLDGWVVMAITGTLAVMLPVLFLYDLSSLLSAPRVATAFHLLPVLVTGLIGVEKAFGFDTLATPFLWTPILVGCGIVLVGVAAAWVE